MSLKRQQHPEKLSMMSALSAFHWISKSQSRTRRNCQAVVNLKRPAFHRSLPLEVPSVTTVHVQGWRGGLRCQLWTVSAAFLRDLTIHDSSDSSANTELVRKTVYTKHYSLNLPDINKNNLFGFEIPKQWEFPREPFAPTTSLEKTNARPQKCFCCFVFDFWLQLNSELALSVLTDHY